MNDHLEIHPVKVVVFTDQFYWGAGSCLAEAISNAQKAGGSGTRTMNVTVYQGPQEDLDEITIDGGGGVTYRPSRVVKTSLGMLKAPMKQPERKQEND